MFLIGISTSGNAMNVCAAMEAARARGLVCIGLTGQGGGKLLPLTDFCVRAPSAETYLIQEHHLGHLPLPEPDAGGGVFPRGPIGAGRNARVDRYFRR